MQRKKIGGSDLVVFEVRPRSEIENSIRDKGHVGPLALASFQSVDSEVNSNKAFALSST